MHQINNKKKEEKKQCHINNHFIVINFPLRERPVYKWNEQSRI